MPFKPFKKGSKSKGKDAKDEASKPFGDDKVAAKAFGKGAQKTAKAAMKDGKLVSANQEHLDREGKKGAKGVTKKSGKSGFLPFGKKKKKSAAK